MEPNAEELIVEEGSWGFVRYALRTDDSSPAKDFIEKLDERDQRSLATLFERMAEHGKITNEEKFKKLTGSIFEFKKFQIRIGCFQVGRNWYLTHGFRKKKDHWPPAELDRAEQIRREHMARLRDGS